VIIKKKRFPQLLAKRADNAYARSKIHSTKKKPSPVVSGVELGYRLSKQLVAAAPLLSGGCVLVFLGRQKDERTSRSGKPYPSAVAAIFLNPKPRIADGKVQHNRLWYMQNIVGFFYIGA